SRAGLRRPNKLSRAARPTVRPSRRRLRRWDPRAIPPGMPTRGRPTPPAPPAPPPPPRPNRRRPGRGGHARPPRTPPPRQQGDGGQHGRGPMTAGNNKWIGQSVKRLEDPPLVRGRGRFAADISFPHQLHMRIVRANHAHGKIVAIDTSAAPPLPP